MIDHSLRNHTTSSAVLLAALSPALRDFYDRLVAQVPVQVAGMTVPLVNALTAHEPLPMGDEIVMALSGGFSSADELNALGIRLSTLALAVPASVAFEMAAILDFADESLWDAWGGPFNGQEHRQGMFDQLVERVGFSAIVETGTFRGSTTEFMANITRVPVFSCELSERFFYFARRRLASCNNVQLFCKDSRSFLREIVAGDLLGGGPAFFYLDAHWGQDLPLWEEVNIILGRLADAVVMIDDFRVPGDSGFGYDDYGPGKRLTILELRTNIAYETDIFFPRHPCGAETGAKRGVVILARGHISNRIARDVSLLERTDWQQAMLLDAAQQEMSVLRQEAQRSKQEAELSRQEAERSKQEADRSKQETTASQQEVIGLQERITALRQQVAELQQQATTWHQEAVGVSEQVIALRQEAAGLQGQIDAIRSSTSWRITAPVRALRSQLHQVNRLLTRLHHAP
jgi:predicted O-methyltransferase YrrM